ncbi:MAG: Gfo/Idh/MocA family oxidoreductase [Verrucomicrobiota bacterium]
MTATPLASQTPATTAPLRLAMLGMIDGNGHPWSWSSIVNGYDRDKMAACPYPVIPQYMNARPAGSVGIPGARVTHLWTDKAVEAPQVAAAALIPNIVARPEDVIGQVDAVFIATDDGFDHVERVRPFVDAGLPVFVDKPLALTVADLSTFIRWQKQGARILSSSGLRYAPELDPLLANPTSLGALRWISAVSCKTWERYGIHLLEPVFCLLGSGFVSVRLESTAACEIAHIIHASGVEVTLPVIKDGGATFGTMHLCGTAGQQHFKFSDTYTGFRRQLVSFIDYVRSGVDPYPFAETVELMSVLIAGIVSKQEGGRRVSTAEIQSQLSS